MNGVGFCRSRLCELSSAVFCWPKNLGEHAVLPAYYTLGDCTTVLAALRRTEIHLSGGWQRREKAGAGTLMQDGEKRPLLKTICHFELCASNCQVWFHGTVVGWLLLRHQGLWLWGWEVQRAGGRTAGVLPRQSFQGRKARHQRWLSVSEGQTNTRIGYVCDMYEIQ